MASSGISKSVEYAEVQSGGKAQMNEQSMRIDLPDGMTFVVPKMNVLMLRNFCNLYMKEYGAFDTYGRAVIDEASGNG